MTEAMPIEESDRLIASDKVEGTRVFDQAGNKLGSIMNFMVNKRSGKAEYAVLQFGGLFGFDREYFPLPWDVLKYDKARGGYVVDLPKERLENAPHYRESTPSFDTAYGQQIYGYYGLPYPFL